ncbi:MAG: hypothetical protein ACQESF_07305 [Nanobdellota archaeon]
MALIRVTPDKEKARSILKMVDTTIEMIGTIDVSKYSSNITKEYYNVLRELIGIVLLLDGYKTYGEGAHKTMIEYIENYKEFARSEIILIDELRKTRNRIAYDGFFVEREFIERKLDDISNIIKKLKEIINHKLSN